MDFEIKLTVTKPIHEIFSCGLLIGNVRQTLTCFFLQESAMAQESPKNSAAEIPVTSNGQLEDSHEYSFNRVRIFFAVCHGTIIKNVEATIRCIAVFT